MASLLVSLWIRSVLAGALGILFLAMARNQSGATKFAVAAGSLIAMVLVPLASLITPAHPIEVSSAPGPMVYLTVSAPRPLRSLQGRSEESPAPPAEGEPNRIGLLAWAGIGLILAARLGCDISAMGRVIRHASNTGLMRTGITILEDPSSNSPATAWWGRPVVLLPPGWRSWSEERLSRVLDHESAHIRRRDWHSLVVARLLCAALWPNPLAWVSLRSIRDAAENAADDAVLAGGAKPSGYAADLLEFARNGGATRPDLAIPMAAKAQVARRIEMILNRSRKRGKVNVYGLVGGTALGISLCLPLSSWALKVQAAQKSSARPAFRIYARIYRLDGSLPAVNHREAMRGDAKCTDCHRMRKDQNLGVVGSSTVVMSLDKDFAERVAERAGRNGTLLTSPSLVALDGQAATIQVSIQGQDGHAFRLTTTPHRADGDAIRLRVHFDEIVGEKPVGGESAEVVVKKGQEVMLDDRASHRMILLSAVPAESETPSSKVEHGK